MKLTLTFKSVPPSGNVVLDSTRFTNTAGAETTFRVRRSSKGLAALAELCVVTRIAAVNGPADAGGALTGPKKSSACDLHTAVYNGDKITWPRDIFGTHDTFKSVIEARTKDEKTSFEVGFRREPGGASAPALELVLDGTPVGGDLAALTRLATALGLNVKAPGPATGALRLRILRSANLAYANDIVRGLLARLKERGYTTVPEQPVDVHGPDVPPLTATGLDDGWRIAINDLLGRNSTTPTDYVVAVGTQAAQALRAHYGAALGTPECPTVLFLGVTYPVAEGLVDSLFSRREPRRIGGVAYGADGLRSIAATIHNWLLPGCRIRFVYFDQHAQDAEAAEQLKQTRLYKVGALEVCSVTPETFAAALDDPEVVYLSWFTFEAIFESKRKEHEGCRALLRQRRVIATTRVNCEHGLTFASVAADDRAIGRLGAELVHKLVTSEIADLGRHDVVIPEIGYWINERVAAQMGIRFPDAVLAEAREKKRVFEPVPVAPPDSAGGDI